MGWGRPTSCNFNDGGQETKINTYYKNPAYSTDFEQTFLKYQTNMPRCIHMLNKCNYNCTWYYFISPSNKKNSTDFDLH